MPMTEEEAAVIRHLLNMGPEPTGDIEGVKALLRMKGWLFTGETLETPTKEGVRALYEEGLTTEPA